MTPKLTGEGAEAEAEVKKSIAIFANKQRLLSIDIKTKLVQHVLTIIFKVIKVIKVFNNIQTLEFWFPPPV